MLNHGHRLVAATLIGVFAASVASAQMQMPMPMQTPAQPQGQVMRGQAEGEVTRIVKETNRITLKHGPIQAMDMAGMTMVFQVKDPALLDKVKVGDKVRFTVLREGGTLYVEKFDAPGAAPVGAAPAGAAPAGGALLEAPEDPHAGH